MKRVTTVSCLIQKDGIYPVNLNLTVKRGTTHVENMIKLFISPDTNQNSTQSDHENRQSIFYQMKSGDYPG